MEFFLVFPASSQIYKQQQGGGKEIVFSTNRSDPGTGASGPVVAVLERRASCCVSPNRCMVPRLRRV